MTVSEVLDELDSISENINISDHMILSPKQIDGYHERLRASMEKMRVCSCCKSILPISKFYTVLNDFNYNTKAVFYNGQWHYQKRYLCNECNYMRLPLYRVGKYFRSAL